MSAHGSPHARAELSVRIKSLISTMDSDHSYTVTETEFVDGVRGAPRMYENGALRTVSAADLFQAVDQRGTKRVTTSTLGMFVTSQKIDLTNAKFRSADKNSDRQLSLAELSSFLSREGVSSKSARASIFRAMDSDHNGRVKFIEFRDASEDILALAAFNLVFGGSAGSTGSAGMSS